MMRNKAIFNWSGGKDSALAFHKILQDGAFENQSLVTTVNEAFDRVSMHGVRRGLLEKQAESIGIPLQKIMIPENCDMETYNGIMKGFLKEIKKTGAEYSIFGDIFLEDLKSYREQQLRQAEFRAVFPLWKQDTRTLIEDFIALGFRSVLVCVNEKYLDASWCGRLIDASFLEDLPADVDPCGENGEYHSFVFDGPIFSKPIAFTTGETVYRNYKTSESEDQPVFDTGFYYLDLY